MIRNLIKIASITALLPSLFVCLGANADVKNYENTWFEIEVILFSQLGDKSQLQEAFPETSNVPTPAKIIDLLGPYLDPNIADLKSRLPHCSNFSLEHNSAFTATSFAINYVVNSKEIVENKPIIPIRFNDLNNNENTIFNQEKNQSINYSTFNFSRKLCAIPEVFFNQYKKENPHFSYNETPIANIPFLIAGEEDLSTDKPYLINQESLQLHDIVKQLKRSRNFKPMLHMGWRQITQSKKNAASLKLYAGENLMQPYYNEMSRYNNQQKKSAADQMSLHNVLNEQTQLANNAQNTLAFRDQQTELKNNITHILQQAKNSQPTLDSVLNKVNNSADDLVTPLMQDDTLENSNKRLLPQIPPQAWSIDGFLTVDVGHFLHVTANFNILNMSLGEQATKQLTSSEQVPLKSIHFEQNKRVRSKEIHYFDHPYMGIIVQIRRHNQVAPIEETNNEPLTGSLVQSSTVN